MHQTDIKRAFDNDHELLCTNATIPNKINVATTMFEFSNQVAIYLTKYTYLCQINHSC